MRNPKEHNLSDEHIFFVCERFISGEGATKIAEWLTRDVTKVSREQVYGLIKKGLERGFIKLCPPPEMALTQRLVSVYPQAAADIQVLRVEPATATQHLTMAAAEKALLIIKELGRKKDPVHIGLGAGYTTERFARNLALRLRSEPMGHLPRLVFHAMSSGFLTRKPTTAPVAFFSYFQWLGANVDYVGLFSEPFVQWDHYEMVKNSPGVREAFEEGSKIDIVITSLASRTDEHGLFNEFLRMGPAKGVRALVDAGWVGDVQWRPYSNEGPLTLDTGTRPVTLFELEDLVDMAMTPNKHVILIAGPCAVCGNNRSAALTPLMQQRNLRVFNHLITDSATAEALLDGDSN